MTGNSFIGATHVYIVAIGWLFVVGCMTVVEATTSSVLGALGTLLLYGLLPLGLFLWLFGTPQRHRNRNNPSPAPSGASFTRRERTPHTEDDDQ